MDKTTIVCPNPACESRVMDLTSTADVPDRTGNLTLYQCAGCGRLGAVILNAEAGMSQHGQSWIENELKEKGFLFPADYTGSGSGHFGGGGRFGR